MNTLPLSLKTSSGTVTGQGLAEHPAYRPGCGPAHQAGGDTEPRMPGGRWFACRSRGRGERPVLRWVHGFSKVRFERMGQGRYASQYFDPARPEKTDDDARWALELAGGVLAATRELLESGRLDLY